MFVKVAFLCVGDFCGNYIKRNNALLVTFCIIFVTFVTQKILFINNKKAWGTNAGFLIKHTIRWQAQATFEQSIILDTRNLVITLDILPHKNSKKSSIITVHARNFGFVFI